MPSLLCRTNVLIDSRFAGGVAMIDRSLIPDIAILRVRGMGVAVSVRISTSARRDLSFSFWRTPNLCSSSMISRPRFLKSSPSWIRPWVPMMISRLPVAIFAITAFCSFFVLKREMESIFTGHSTKRSLKVSVCCRASRVVGTSIATCLPDCMAINAARIATSVLPNPTSPQISRSMDFSETMSEITFSMADSWSGVSSKGNARANWS